MLVAAVAIADHLAERGLEAGKILDGFLRSLGFLSEFREAGFEIVHVRPDLGGGARVPARFRVLRKQVGHLVRSIEEGRKYRAPFSEVERNPAADHIDADFSLPAI